MSASQTTDQSAQHPTDCARRRRNDGPAGRAAGPPLRGWSRRGSTATTGDAVAASGHGDQCSPRAPPPPPTSSRSSTRGGGPRTTCRSARSTCSTTRCSASRSALEHIKPRLLGHWGTTPGLNLVYAHLNRVIRARDLDIIYVCGPGHGGPGMVANTYLEGTYTEIYPHVGRDEDRAAPPVPPVLVPGRHPQPRRPRDARVDQRGRRARLRPRPRLRRRVRQPGPGGRLRHRRRRGRDRAAGRQLALQQVPRPADRRGRAADPPPQRLQDRQPDRPGPHPRRGAGVAPPGLRPHRPPRRGRRPRLVHRTLADTLDTCLDEIAAIQRAWRRRQRDRAAGVADDRAAHPQGLDRARTWSTAFRSRARSAPTRCRWPGWPRTPSTCASWRSGCGATGPRSCSTTAAACGRRSPPSRPRATGGWAPTPTPTAGDSAATSTCPTSGTTPSTCPVPAGRRPSRPG